MRFSFNQQNMKESVSSKMRLCLLLLCILMNYLIYGQTIPLTSSCNWKNMCLNRTYAPAKGDSCLFVVSTRNFDEAKKEFVDYDYDTSATLKYFIVYYNQDTWTAV